MDGVVTKLGDGIKDRLKLLILDVTSDASVQTAFVTVKKEHGKIHGLVNNAGGFAPDAKSMVDLNTYGVTRMCEAFAPIIEDGGRIVQVRRESCTVNFTDVSRYHLGRPPCSWKSAARRRRSSA